MSTSNEQDSAGPSSSQGRVNIEAGTCIHRIHTALAPRIAVLAGADVDDVLRPNNLQSFSDLLRPFQEAIENVSVRTSQLETRQCATFPLAFDSLEAFAPSSVASAASSDTTLFTPADLLAQEQKETPQDDAERLSRTSSTRRRPTRQKYARPEVLLDAISERVSSKSKGLWEIRPENRSTDSSRHVRKSSTYTKESGIVAFSEALEETDVNEDDIDVLRYRQEPIESLTPWFIDTRDMVLDARKVAEHETFGHPMAIVIVVSASSADPMNALANLFEASQGHVCPAFSKRPFVDPFVFRYYVLLHDVSKSGVDVSESVALLENVKKTYGLHCCLLPINSAGSVSSTGQPSTRSDTTSDLWRSSLRSNARRYMTQSTTHQNDASVGSPTSKQLKSPVEVWYDDDDDKEDAEQKEEFATLIDDDDVRRIRAFVRDFSAQSLIPFMERCVSLWTEQVTASRRGLTGRLLGAGRKFFGGGSSRSGPSGSASQTTASFAQLGYYPHTTLEAQTRRLADFAFLTRDYKLAASMYDLGRRDYANDKAHKFIAGANEMFGLSHLMVMLHSRTPPVDVDSYLAAAGAHYLLAPRQKGSSLQLDSLRATILYYEAYRALRFYRSAPQALIRTANEGSTEAENDLEVVAAMLLEQAALSDLRQSGKPALRKSALHLVMAAHRYRKCGQKQLSLRCFQASAFFYRILRRASYLTNDDKKAEADDEDAERISDYVAKYESVQIQAWDLINDHMEHEMAQQAFNDGRIAQAAVHYATILQRQATSAEASEAESASRHEAYLQGFETCCKYLDEDLADVLRRHGMEPSLRLLDAKETSVIVNAAKQHDDLPWRKLEEIVLGQSVERSYKERNTTAVNETFWIRISVRNPLNTALQVSKLTAEFVEEGEVSTDKEGAVKVSEADDFTLAPLEARQITVAVSSTVACTLRCVSIRYTLSGGIPMREPLVKPGRRLNDTKAQRSSKVASYAPSEITSVVVHESKAIIEAEFSSVPERLGLGEEVAVEIALRNVGKAAVNKIVAHINRPDTLIDAAEQDQIAGGADEHRTIEVQNSLRTHRSFEIPLLGNDGLSPGQSVNWPVRLRGSALGTVNVRILIVFQSMLTGEQLTSQLQHQVKVDPVLDMAIQAVPAHTDDLRYELRLDAISLLPAVDEEQHQSKRHVVIDKISFVGPSWVADGQIKESSDTPRPFQEIRRDEKSDAHLLIKHAPAESKSGTQAIANLAHTVERLRALLTGRGLQESAGDAPQTALQVSFLQLNDGDVNQTVSPFLFKARREYRMALLAAEFPALIKTPLDGNNGGRDEEEQIEQIFPLYEPRELDIVAHWRIVGAEDGPTRTGQAFIFGLTLGPLHDYLSDLFQPAHSSAKASLANGTGGGAGSAPTTTRTMYAQTEREKASIWSNVRQSRLHVDEDPILLEFELPKSVDVAADARQSFDVQFVLRNLSPLHTYSVTLQLDNTSPPTGSAAAAAAAAAIAASSHSATLPPVYASYIGRLTLRATLAPLARTVLHAKASIGKSGRVHVAPVLVRSSKASSAADGDERKEFSRWEYCTQVVIS